MFYYVPTERMDSFRAAIQAIGEMYGTRMFAADNLIALCRSRSFQSDPKFADAFNSTADTAQEKSLLWRLHTLTWAATQALSVDGDFVECGVLHGFSSTVICKFLDFARLDRSYYLYDTFAGLTDDTSTEYERLLYPSYGKLDGDQWIAGVRERFAPYPNVRIVQGTVPASFAQACPDKIAFLHLDMNATQAEIGALEHLFERVAVGGMIILDDFGWDVHELQSRAEAAFFKARGHAVLELPTGQGMVVKHGSR